MTALAANKKIVEMQTGWARSVEDFGNGTPLAAGVFYNSALVCFDTSDSRLKPGATSTTLIPVGICDGYFPANSTSIKCRTGIFKFVNAGDITAANAGANCYITDDQTVTMTTTGRSVAGKVIKVESDGVFVSIMPDK